MLPLPPFTIDDAITRALDFTDRYPSTEKELAAYNETGMAIACLLNAKPTLFWSPSCFHNLQMIEDAVIVFDQGTLTASSETLKINFVSRIEDTFTLNGKPAIRVSLP